MVLENTGYMYKGNEPSLTLQHIEQLGLFCLFFVWLGLVFFFCFVFGFSWLKEKVVFKNMMHFFCYPTM